MASLRLFTRRFPQVTCVLIPQSLHSSTTVRSFMVYFKQKALHRNLLTPKWCQHVVSREYAKKAKKDKAGNKGKSKGPSVSLSPEEIGDVINYEKMMSQYDEVLEHLNQEYIKQLSLRTNVGAFDNLIVETDDGKFPLNQLAQIVQKNPSLLLINMGPVPQYIPAVTDALTKSGMNINPQQDGNMIFVNLPKVTREHRESLAKNAKTLCDRSKLKLRDVHNNYTKVAKKHKDVSEDTVHSVIELIQNKLHESQARADDLMHKKREEILGK